MPQSSGIVCGIIVLVFSILLSFILLILSLPLGAMQCNGHMWCVFTKVAPHKSGPLILLRFAMTISRLIVSRGQGLSIQFAFAYLVSCPQPPFRTVSQPAFSIWSSIPENLFWLLQRISLFFSVGEGFSEWGKDMAFWLHLKKDLTNSFLFFLSKRSFWISDCPKFWDFWAPPSVNQLDASLEFRLHFRSAIFHFFPHLFSSSRYRNCIPQS